MKEVTRFVEVFGNKTERCGQLYIHSEYTAYSVIFEIYVIKAGVKLFLPDEAVLVYGLLQHKEINSIYYGWKYDGKWQNDFYSLVEKREKETKTVRKKVLKDKEQERINKILNSYEDAYDERLVNG